MHLSTIAVAVGLLLPVVAHAQRPQPAGPGGFQILTPPPMTPQEACFQPCITPICTNPERYGCVNLICNRDENMRITAQGYESSPNCSAAIEQCYRRCGL